MFLGTEQKETIEKLAAAIVMNPRRIELDLFPLVEMEPEKIFELSAAKVLELSHNKVRIVRGKHGDGFPFVIMGPASYCKRIDESGSERCFTIFAGCDGLSLH